MSSQPASPRSSNTNYRRNMLIIAAIGAVSSALLVFPAWWSGVFNPRPPTGNTSSTIAHAPPSPSPITRPTEEPTPTKPISRATVCGQWRSVSSQKNYNFICQSQSSFEIHEMSSGIQTNTGSGSVGPNGEVQANMQIAKKDRIAHLRLQLSSDGQTLVGSWYGDDQREAGTLSFQRMQ